MHSPAYPAVLRHPWLRSPPPPLEALTPDHPKQGADSNRNHLRQNTPKRKRDESSRPHAGHPQGWGTLLCLKRGGLLQSGRESAGPAPGCFCQLWSNKNQAVAAKGTQRFPSRASGPEMAVVAERAVGVCRGGGFRAPVPAAKAGLAGGGHMAGSSVRCAIPAADRQQPAESPREGWPCQARALARGPAGCQVCSGAAGGLEPMGRHGTAGTVGCLHANRLPLLIPGAPGDVWGLVAPCPARIWARRV